MNDTSQNRQDRKTDRQTSEQTKPHRTQINNSSTQRNPLLAPIPKRITVLVPTYLPGGGSNAIPPGAAYGTLTTFTLAFGAVEADSRALTSRSSWISVQHRQHEARTQSEEILPGIPYMRRTRACWIVERMPVPRAYNKRLFVS